jgi:hypothetical protein
MLGVPPKSSGGATNRCVMSRLTKCAAPDPLQTALSQACRGANTSPVNACARPRARGHRKSKTVAGRQGRALANRSADSIREKRPHPHGCPGRRDSRQHQGVWLDDAGAGGRGRRSDCGPRQGARGPAARHRRDSSHGRRGLERGAETGLCPSFQNIAGGRAQPGEMRNFDLRRRASHWRTPSCAPSAPAG